METVSTPISTFNPREPIPGYVLRERIGEGGYGEVWSSDAPGGLSKAVKIVYGAANASKAERELKALNRIKQVQHPLLLSLERIEIVDGHLVIVTELADCSLKDRFQERLADGNLGIERSELFGYLSDAADALDFLYAKHSLQHLDVKPENLLLLANRVKVADFGMVKDLHEKQETLVAGMTPLYAPPEIYDGKPNQHSDQYSLAVVYQQLISGEPPFAGRTAAQLAAQHLHGTPNLSPLTDRDRPVVARALSKDPNRRFSCCQEFIVALRDAETGTRNHKARRRQPAGARGPSAKLAARSSPAATEVTAGTIELPWPTSVETLAPLANATLAIDAVPCLFVGVGQVAGKVLQHVRRRITAQFGPREAIPAFQFLLFDTDTKSLTDATSGNREAALDLNETVAIPLREAKHYRSRSELLLEWLERRWLYNIPRTLQTEGLRPLGRLAFVDHYPAVVDALGRTIEQATDNELLDRSSQTLGRPVNPGSLRVFVIGSTTGGTSSGVLLDLAYTVRSILQERRLSEDHLHGVMLHATRNTGGSRDLQLGTSIAFLREFAHYCTEGVSYPGEPTCGIPAFSSQAAPFAHPYLLDLGDRLTPAELELQTARTADHLFTASVSTASSVIQRARETELFAQFGPGECRVRSFATAHVSGDDQRDRTAADNLCRHLVQRWVGNENREELPLDEIAALTERFCDGLDLHPTPLLERAAGLTKAGVVIEDPADFLQQVVRAALETASDSPPAMAQEAGLEAVDDLMSGLAGGRELGHGISWKELLAESLQSEVEPRVNALLDWFSMLAKQPKVRLRGVQHAVACILEQFSSLELVIATTSQNRMHGFSKATGSRTRESLLQYATIRFQQQADRSVAGYVGTIRRQIQEYETRLREFRRHLDELLVEFTVQDGGVPQSPATATLERRQRQLLVEFENRLKAMSLGVESLSEMTHSGAKTWSDLAGTFRQVAGQIVATANAKQRVSQFVSTVQQLAPESEGEIDLLLAQARPRLHQCGGSERPIVIAPQDKDFDQALASLTSHPSLQRATVVRTAEEGISVCYEMSDVPLANAIIKLSAGRSQCLELADRLASRIDVDWRDASD